MRITLLTGEMRRPETMPVMGSVKGLGTSIVNAPGTLVLGASTVLWGFFCVLNEG